ncbi:XRE family transcriptional regulator [Lactobacillus selangorensis]|uniref:XRE family transcriptional regulator n=1 Tax=Lactobacillus selangorensis TaxID=81857 RepID=A0A0R2FU56_9LACO|nr:helix-turn-helix domain-containing protein [Lactobacillus selangorensis]KRN28404.1 XRE family transcriptional regulator [Lactobacillus selangorensis]KRN31905.1 XRE family transcriptional regulator [Lactobacillus selangorensis]
MELKEQLKKYRQQMQWTQKELAAELNVSDKTISSWETGRTYPDVEMLLHLSKLFAVPLEELMTGDVKMVQTIDENVRQKKWYQGILIALLLLLAGSILFLKTYQYQNQWVDRFNPFLEMKVGYATLPKKVQAPYKNIWSTDDSFGSGTRLDFYAGETEPGKNYAMIQHKGLYVRRVALIPWKTIPSTYRNIMTKNPKLANAMTPDEPNHH